MNLNSNQKQLKREYSFWFWLIDGRKGGGLSRWFNRWLLWHIAVGLVFSYQVHANLPDLVRSTMLPFAAALFGLTLAWVATANNFVSSTEFRRVMYGSPSGVRGTINYLQMVVYLVLLCGVYWGIVGLGPYPISPKLDAKSVNWGVKFIGFFLTSFAILECGSSINVTRLAMLSHNVASVAEESDISRSDQGAKVETSESNQ